MQEDCHAMPDRMFRNQRIAGVTALVFTQVCIKSSTITIDDIVQ